VELPIEIGESVARETIRMGTGGRPRRALVGVAAGVAIAAAAVVAALLMWGSDGAPSRRVGCALDADCGAGRLCARGGCLPLTGAEDLRFWRAEVDAQLLRGATWRPRPSYGEKLAPAEACPAKLGKVNLLEPGKLSLVRRTHVFELFGDTARIHVQSRMRGLLWMEAIRFSFPTVKRINLARLCSSPTVAQVAMEAGRADVVDAALTQAAPAGTVASAALSLEIDLPRADADGFRTFAFPLDPAAGDGTVVTVLALPLGTDVAQMTGPVPGRQRLLTGYVAYYWSHDLSKREVSVSLKTPAVAAGLSVAELKP
jgi:hypothetical protein